MHASGRSDHDRDGWEGGNRAHTAYTISTAPARHTDHVRVGRSDHGGEHAVVSRVSRSPYRFVFLFFLFGRVTYVKTLLYARFITL